MHVLKSRGVDASYRIFVATDEAAFITYLKKKHPERVFYLKDAPRLSEDEVKKDRSHYAQMKMHAAGGVHKNTAFSPYWKGLSAVRLCMRGGARCCVWCMRVCQYILQGAYLFPRCIQNLRSTKNIEGPICNSVAQ